jgi:hypothetical protein
VATLSFSSQLASDTQTLREIASGLPPEALKALDKLAESIEASA